MTRGRLAIHAHFYQPWRADPFSGRVAREPAAAPFHDWNARISAECYRPNLERGSVARVSFDLGPTLAGWLAREEPATLAAFRAADHGQAMAQAFHHPILPLASAEDRRTEVRWAVRAFELGFGRRPLGLWLPEAAVDLPTLRVLAEHGIRYTILAPWQAEDPGLDTRRPYRVAVGRGRSIVVVFCDAVLSAAVSFDPAATADAERFARERVAPRLAEPLAGGGVPLALIATDGELYGHHQPFRDLFLQRLVAPPADAAPRPFDVVDLAEVVLAARPAALPVTRIRERTSWSCHHGVARWTAECPDAADGRWKGPLRAALERLAGGIDAATDAALAGLPGRPGRTAARDAYVDVVVGAEPPEAFAGRWLGPGAGPEARATFLDLLEAQRWRLAMFASDGWYWDDPVRPETRQVLLAAARAARLVDGWLARRSRGSPGSSGPSDSPGLEARLVADLALLRSPSTGADGAAIYRESRRRSRSLMRPPGRPPGTSRARPP